MAMTTGAMVRAFVSSMEDTILQHPLWKDATEDEIENIAEGIEKYILTKLYDWYAHSVMQYVSMLMRRVQHIPDSHCGSRERLVSQKNSAAAVH
jgi:hypothetical protein